MLSHSSSPNGSLVGPHVSINSSINFYMYCLMSGPGSIIFSASCITHILLLLPLCIFILRHAFQQWKQTPSSSSSSAPMTSHSDSLTYHMVTTELMGVCGCTLFCCGIFREDVNVLYAGSLFSFFLWYAQVFFHILMCLERYLAVIHPLIYRNLRNERGIRIRNISIGCVWLLSFTGMGLVLIEVLSVIMSICSLILAVTVISIGSISMLCVLIRPGPGERGGNRERVDHSKQRAYRTIIVIMGFLVVKLVCNVAWQVTYMSKDNRYCLLIALGGILNMPSSLLLPLLFLYRLRKLVCC